MSLSGNVHSSWLRLDYQFGLGLACLLTMNSDYQAMICRGKTDVIGSTCNHGNDTICTELDMANGFINSSSLRGGTAYTYSAFVKHGDVTVCAFNTLTLHTPEDKPTPKDKPGLEDMPTLSTTKATPLHVPSTGGNKRNHTILCRDILVGIFTI